MYSFLSHFTVVISRATSNLQGEISWNSDSSFPYKAPCTQNCINKGIMMGSAHLLDTGAERTDSESDANKVAL